MGTTGWILFGLGMLALVLILFLVVPGVTLRAIGRSLRPRIAAAVPAENVVLEDLRANTLGLTSKGVTQSRGNGALVLTDSELLFFQVLPRREYVIPLSEITEVKTVRSHLGKTYFRDLLYVAFRSGSGSDSIAWYVTDLPAWLNRLSTHGTAQPVGSPA